MPPALSSSNPGLILEEPLIRTPYELLRRSHRSAQRQVEKDFTAISSALNALIKSYGGKTSEENRDTVVSKLDQAGERVRGLKRKLDDLQPQLEQPSPLRSRLTYLDNLSNPNKPADPKASDAPGDSTLDRYIIDHLLRSGRIKSADTLAAKQGLDDLVDVRLFSELARIESALVDRQSVTEALAWCGENRGTLKKTQNTLEFTLRLQEFIELCRRRDTVGAIAYSRKHLSTWASTHLVEIQQGMTLLAFGERTGVGAYRRMYDRARWMSVRDRFRKTFLDLYALPSQSLLALSLSAGLSALRLPSCVTHHSEKAPTTSPHIPLLPAAPPLHNLEDVLLLSPHSSFVPHLTAPIGGDPSTPATDLHTHPEAQVGNIDCPTCGPDVKVLAAEVPMSHHVNSTIVCRISGAVMDSDNEPLAFPNGYVYSAKVGPRMTA
ncbi:CTLH/CRA C-terminal to lish motif domain-domain-containing protein [Naematelia encephala]|uniref:CTLH/CRA C-terminal to lish motif domain-domain-containing protein n=1 Tax=Naematelia encephala TaxID=71784 RepID=A0A1Y2BGM2_9TREE|nr:CTLH/CRA C-terminal to lish motif domain-domain-containing protein [Naematelia encephala]